MRTKAFAASAGTILICVMIEMGNVRVAGVIVAGGQGRQAGIKVATWNVRSGMGISAGVNSKIDSSTTDCTRNASKPNGPFWKALDTIKNDPQVIALGVQEAWACASVKALRAYLGWAFTSAEKNGTALLARHGIKGEPSVQQIGYSGAYGASEDQWAFAADVCVDATCGRAVRVSVAHFAFNGEAGAVAQAGSLVAFGNQPRSILIGDFNINTANRVFVPCATRRTESLAARVFADARFVDVWAALKPGVDGPTGMWNRKGCGSPRGGLFKRIDYIYARGYRPIDIALFALIQPWIEDAPSDHAGIVATFEAP